MLKTTVMTALLIGAAAAGAQTPDARAGQKAEPVTTPAPQAENTGFHDLICKPKGSEDEFDCADEATPAHIVPIPSQVQGPPRQNEPISG